MSTLNLDVCIAAGRGIETSQLPPTSNRYRAVKSIINRALILLESNRGRRALRDLVIAIVRGRRAQNQRYLYPRGEPDSALMDQYLDFFLQRMRSGFPETYLTPTEGEALTVRDD